MCNILYIYKNITIRTEKQFCYSYLLFIRGPLTLKLMLAFHSNASNEESKQTNFDSFKPLN